MINSQLAFTIPAKTDRDSQAKTLWNQPITRLAFFGISLLLSLMIMIVATAVFVVEIFLKGAVSAFFFYLFVSIIAVNLAVSGFSLWGIILTYTSIIVYMDRTGNGEFMS